jgi:hypothetical protein
MDMLIYVEAISLSPSVSVISRLSPSASARRGLRSEASAAPASKQARSLPSPPPAMPVAHLRTAPVGWLVGVCACVVRCLPRGQNAHLLTPRNARVRPPSSARSFARYGRTPKPSARSGQSPSRPAPTVPAGRISDEAAREGARATPPRRPAAAHVSWSGTVARHLARASHLAPRPAPLDLGVVSHCCTGRARSVCCPWPCARADRPDCRAKLRREQSNCRQLLPRAGTLVVVRVPVRVRCCAFAALRARWIVAGVHVHVHVPGCDFLAILLFCVDCGTGEGWAVHSARSCAWSTRRLFTVESN